MPQPRKLFCKSVEMANNIYRQAKQLRNDKPVLERNEEESEVIKIAMMPLLQLRQFSDIPIDDGLDELAEIVEEAQKEVK